MSKTRQILLDALGLPDLNRPKRLPIPDKLMEYFERLGIERRVSQRVKVRHIKLRNLSFNEA